MAHYKGAASEAGRAMQLIKKREIQQQETELRKKKIEEDLKVQNMDSKFASHFDAVEMQLKADTVGLVTLDQMKAKQETIVKEREKKLAQKEKEKNKEQMKALEAKEAEKSKQRKQIQTLSFNIEDDEGEENEDNDGNLSSDNSSKKKWTDLVEPAKKKIKKNPNVDTSFLPDREREEAENKMREELRKEWAEKQQQLKDEEIEITFSYWVSFDSLRTLSDK